ncbi:MAG: hypothetical protein HZA54_11180 [Planctomycetes bacterium]|nr:hypothetical protein [Planctomycetota bacterium]
MCSSSDDPDVAYEEDVEREHEARLPGTAWMLHCLVVEGEPVLRARLATVIRRGAHWVTTAADRIEVMAYAGVGNFDAILIGPHLACGSGEMLAAELRSRCPTARILLLAKLEAGAEAVAPTAVDVRLSLAAPFLEEAILHEVEAGHKVSVNSLGRASRLALFR